MENKLYGLQFFETFNLVTKGMILCSFDSSVDPEK